MHFPNALFQLLGYDVITLPVAFATFHWRQLNFPVPNSLAFVYSVTDFMPL